MMRIIYLTSRLDEYYNTSPEMGISVTYFDMAKTIMKHDLCLLIR